MHNSGFCASAAWGCSNRHQQHSGISLGLTNIAKHWFLIFIFIKSRAAVTGGRNSNTTPAQSPVVGGKLKLPLFKTHSRQDFLRIMFYKVLLRIRIFICRIIYNPIFIIKIENGIVTKISGSVKVSFINDCIEIADRNKLNHGFIYARNGN